MKRRLPNDGQPVVIQHDNRSLLDKIKTGIMNEAHEQFRPKSREEKIKEYSSKAKELRAEAGYLRAKNRRDKLNSASGGFFGNNIDMRSPPSGNEIFSFGDFAAPSKKRSRRNPYGF